VAECKRILIVRLSAIGDVVNVLPAVHLIRESFPHARITFAVEKPASSLLYCSPDIDEVFVIDRHSWAHSLKNPLLAPLAIRQILCTVAALRKRQFDLCLDFQGNARSAAVCLSSASRVRIGFSTRNVREFASIFYTRTVKLPRDKMTRAQKNLRLLKAVGIEPRNVMPPLQFSEQEMSAVNRFFNEQRINDSRVAAVHAGTSKFGAFKKWDEKGYAEVCSKLRSDFRIIPLLTYGPGEKEMVERINSLSGNACIIAPQLRGLKELAYLLKRCSLFIGADTGPMHIAAAVGTPIVAIFGPKDPQIYAPNCPNYIIVRKDIPCSPCEKRSCSHSSCMKAITAEDVLAAVKSIIDARNQSSRFGEGER
jgi:lipopolysaccharide heptosyltransferase I